MTDNQISSPTPSGNDISSPVTVFSAEPAWLSELEGRYDGSHSALEEMYLGEALYEQFPTILAHTRAQAERIAALEGERNNWRELLRKERDLIKQIQNALHLVTVERDESLERAARLEGKLAAVWKELGELIEATGVCPECYGADVDEIDSLRRCVNCGHEWTAINESEAQANV